jgi:hypothetical protein
MSDQDVNAGLRRLAEALKPYADLEEQRLRETHPRLAAYLDMTIAPRKLFMGGWDVLGEIHLTESAAKEAARAAIMMKLIQVDQVWDRVRANVLDEARNSAEAERGMV